MHRILSFILILFTISGCEPAYPPPEGYVDSCYGGDFGEKLAGSKPELLITLELGVEHWPKLKGQLEKIAKENNVRFFFDEREYDGLTMFNASLCSEDGLYMNVDKRIWANSDVSNSPMMLTIYTYKNQSEWVTFIENVKSSMERNWKEYFVKNQSEVSLKLSY
ncbi:MAG TPA: hypothetical protein DCS87_06175 [Rheinheimera sp.]|nr:hypothetical protein [Rheinheimera sp.]